MSLFIQRSLPPLTWPGDVGRGGRPRRDHHGRQRRGRSNVLTLLWPHSVVQSRLVVRATKRRRMLTRTRRVIRVRWQNEPAWLGERIRIRSTGEGVILVVNQPRYLPHLRRRRERLVWTIARLRTHRTRTGHQNASSRWLRGEIARRNRGVPGLSWWPVRR